MWSAVVWDVVGSSVGWGRWGCWLLGAMPASFVGARGEA
jgi:hypothetical protein